MIFVILLENTSCVGSGWGGSIALHDVDNTFYS